MALLHPIAALIPAFLPLALSIIFLLLNIGVKQLANALNFHFVGSDVALCGCSIFLATLLRQIVAKKIPDSLTATAGFVVFFVLLTIWGLCVVVGTKKNRHFSLYSAMAGCGILYFAATFSANLLDI